VSQEESREAQGIPQAIGPAPGRSREISVEAQGVVRAIGWMPGRRIDILPWVREWDEVGVHAHEAARAFLEEFGGLSVTKAKAREIGAGTSFDFDPHECAGEEDRFLEWGDEIGRSLFPIGLTEEGRFFLGIDEYSEIYLVETWVATFGRMPEALEKLVKGGRPATVAE
jgi:hypothetical protein